MAQAQQITLNGTTDGAAILRMLRAIQDVDDGKQGTSVLLEVRTAGAVEHALQSHADEPHYAIPEQALSDVETARLNALRRVCPGFFALERRRVHGRRAP